MDEYLGFLALVLVYFLIVYMVAIRRGGQSVLSWFLVIAIQSASVIWFPRLSEIAAQMIPGLPDIAVKLLVILVLILINLLVIILVNSLLNSRTGDFKVLKNEYPVEVRDLHEIPLLSDVLGKPDAAVSSAETVRDAQDAASAGTDSDMQGGAILATIQQQIDRGDTESAEKYLKMIAFYSQNRTETEKARQMLENIKRKE